MRPGFTALNPFFSPTTQHHLMSCEEKIQQQNPVATPCKVVLAGSIASELLAEVKASLNRFGRAPLLIGFLANTDPAARMYADWTRKTCIKKCV